MSGLSLSWLGPVSATIDNRPVRFRTRKAQALLIYLTAGTALPGSAPARRESLLGLLWPDYTEKSARQSLRTNLSYLKKALSELEQEGSQEPFLLSDNQGVQVNPAIAFSLDLATFSQLLSHTSIHGHADLLTCRECQERLEQAVALYRGDFVSDFYLPDSNEFEAWTLARREEFRRQTLGALETLTASHIVHANFEAAEAYARRQLEIDDLRESAQRQLIAVLARAGRRRAALSHYESFRQRLQVELGIEPSAKTQSLYEAITAGELDSRAEDPIPSSPQSPPPPLPRPPAPLHNLPPQPTSFIGREAELAALDDLIANPNVRLVTVVAQGGMGKTRLAIEAAAAQVENFGQGVVFVALAPVDPTDFSEAIDPLAATLANALSFPLQGGREPTEQLANYLGQKEMLLLFDNFEHLLDSVAVVTGILKGAPRVKIVVTSRERLNLQEEWLYPLEGMLVPEGEVQTSEGAVAGSAMQLFEQRARQAQATFDLAAEYPAVARICRLVEGMPLGIELAAAWARVMSPQEIAQEIEKEIDFLATSLRDIPERHRSLRAVFDQSWRQLSREEQAVLMKLSIFRGGFRRDAAAAVAEASLWRLTALVDKSLIRTDIAGRYSIHERLRQFAAEKLRGNLPTYKEVCDQHTHFYLAFLAEQETHLKGPKLKEGMAAIGADIDNVRTAWRRATEHDKWAELKGAMESLWLFYDFRGWALEGNEAFARVVARLRPLHERPSTTEAGTPLEETGLMLSAALAYQSKFQYYMGDFAQTAALGQESVAVLPAAGHVVRREMALALLLSDDLTGGTENLLESLALFDQIGDRWGSGFALVCLGINVFLQGQYAEAERYSQEARAILMAMGEQGLDLFAISVLGWVAMARGDYAQAETIHQECLKRRLALGFRAGMVFSLRELGHLARYQGEHDQAYKYYQQGIDIGREIGLGRHVTNCLIGLGSLAEMRGDYAAAERFIREGGVGFPAYGSDLVLGWIALGQGDHQAAERYFYGVLKSAAETEMMQESLHALTGLAHLRPMAADPEGVLELLGLILAHPACHPEFKNRAIRLRDELIAELPPQVVQAATARGQQLDLWQTAKQLLHELASDRI